jgi:hypothetical protein
MFWIISLVVFTVAVYLVSALVLRAGYGRLF